MSVKGTAEGTEEGGVILTRGYLVQGESQTIEGGITLNFPKNGKRYGVLQNNGPIHFCLRLYKDEKTFFKKDKKVAKVTEMNFTANIRIHSLEMMIGSSKKPQNIFIIVHGGMPRYFKPTKSAEMMNWVLGFQKVSNAIARKVAMADSQSSRTEATSNDGNDSTSSITNRENKQRLNQDSGIDVSAPTSTDSTSAEDNLQDPDESSLTKLLPKVIEMDIPDKDDHDDVDGPCRRSVMVLNKDRYEERFVGPTPKISPDSNIHQSVQKFEAITEDQGGAKKPVPTPRAQPKTMEEIRENLVSMRLSTWPNRPPSQLSTKAESPYQHALIRTERQPSCDSDEDCLMNAEGGPILPPKTGLARQPSTPRWKTMDLVKEISKQLGDNEKPIDVAPSGTSFKSRKGKTPTRPRTRISEITTDDEDEDKSPAGGAAEVDPPYDRLTKFQREHSIEEGEAGEEREKEGEEGEGEGGRTSLGDVEMPESRKRLHTNPYIGTRPLPKPNQETDWKNVGNLVYEQSCRSVKVCVDREDVNGNLALITMQDEVRIVGWKRESSEKLYGKLHIGDTILQVNDMMVDNPEFAQMLIKSSTKDEIVLVIKRLPLAMIRELRKKDDETSWGITAVKNEVKEVSGPALDGGITPKTAAVLSNKQCEWVITELAHQRVPMNKCAHDEVMGRLEKLSSETSLVLVLHPRDFIVELREGLKHLKHPSQYYV